VRWTDLKSGMLNTRVNNESYRNFGWFALLAAMACATFFTANAEDRPWQVRAADAAIQRWPDGHFASTRALGVEL